LTVRVWWSASSRPRQQGIIVKEENRIGVVGLGLMGTAIGERLLEHGYKVLVWNRTRAKAEPLLALGAEWSDNPFAACERVVISLYSSDVVAQVVDQLRAGLRVGRLLIDTTTGNPDQSAALGRRLAEQGVNYLDAPISGSSEPASKPGAARRP
jgi:3-hydroxyisobutyrate dehydrogenase-like beta-hydroxyacid dehydrogenase